MPSELSKGHVACEACDGTGEGACANCEGTGEVSAECDLGYQHDEECRDCDGTGTMSCCECAGSGQVFDDDMVMDVEL